MVVEIVKSETNMKQVEKLYTSLTAITILYEWMNINAVIAHQQSPILDVIPVL